VGGGPAGLVAAIAARHAGYDVKVFEQAPSFARIGGAIGIQGNGFECSTCSVCFLVFSRTSN
jgi:2-polyprenyl-6-methoxyphenol hydroxylase-like FAD-dependent oxidoreductase